MINILSRKTSCNSDIKSRTSDGNLSESSEACGGPSETFRRHLGNRGPSLGTTGLCSYQFLAFGVIFYQELQNGFSLSVLHFCISYYHFKKLYYAD